MSGRHDFLTLAAERWSVRSFENRPLEQADLDQILEAGRLAPTGCNYQAWRALVLNGGEAMEKLRPCTRCHFGAPAAILVLYNKNECWTRRYDGKQAGEVDASIVATHMMLEAEDIGVGSCWVMYFDPAKTRQAFNIPEELEPVALLVMGYPAKDAAPSPLHEQSRPLDELVRYGSF